jgi:hypothetical protein
MRDSRNGEVKMNSPPEFDVFFEYKFEGSVKLEVNIPRQEIPLVCSAFDIIMSERFGGSFYYPRFPDKRTRCRYEWFLSYKRDHYGIRISTYLDVGNEDIVELPFLLSWGPRFASNIGTPYSKVIQKRIVEEIQSVWTDINKIIHEEPHIIWTFLSHIDLPPGRGIEHIVDSNVITVYPSAQHKKEGTLLSSVGVHIPAHFRAQAKNIGLPIFDKFIALLFLLVGNPITKSKVKWPKNFKFDDAFEGKDAPIEQIYPMTRYKIAPRQHSDLTDVVKIAVDLISQPSIANDEILWQSINAYVAGQEIKQSQPTLSSVAFIASLAAYSKGMKCDGNITCSKCGDLENFHHNSVSEKDALIETIRNALLIELDCEEMRALRNLIRDVYSKQRSAFVHDAKLRHAELDNKNVELGHPGESRIVCEELEFVEDLNSIQEIARRVLLHRLGRDDKRLQAIFDSKSGSRIRPLTSFTFSNTLRARHQVVIRMGRGDNENS